MPKIISLAEGSNNGTTTSKEPPTRPKTTAMSHNSEQPKPTDDEERLRRKNLEMKLLLEKLENLRGPPLEIPEYKDAYRVIIRRRSFKTQHLFN